jgi:hypothetical protein
LLPYLHNSDMKSRYLILPLLFLLLISCSDKNEENLNRNPRVINPVIYEDNSISESNKENAIDDMSYLVPMIDLPLDEYAQKIQDINLDNDTEEEQIILTRKSENEDSHLKLYIADYNNETMRYQTALEQDILVDHMEGLSILIQDITGNQLNEVLITGFDIAGLHTLDAFRIQTLGGAEGLKYREIISLAVNGTIDIETEERSQNYKSGQMTWESFPIITEASDESEDDLDLIKTVYKWNSTAFKYQQVSVSKIPGVTIREENLKKLYRGNLDDFKGFLSGPWFRVSDLNQTEQPFMQEILYFHPEESQVIFTVDDVQEIYEWSDTYRTIFKGIYIQSENQLIKSLRRDIYITIEDMDSIRVKIQGTTEWGGFYEPVSISFQQGLIHNDILKPADEMMELSGLFKSSRGIEMYLDYPFFTEKTTDGKSRKGVLTFYNLYGTNVLQMRYQKENGNLEKRSIYKADFNVTSDSTRIIRTLTLEPGMLTVSGFNQEQGDSLHFEQIEIKESGES